MPRKLHHLKRKIGFPETRLTAEMKFRLKHRLIRRWQEATEPYTACARAHLNRVLIEQGTATLAKTISDVLDDLTVVGWSTANGDEFPTEEAQAIAQRLVLAHFNERVPMGCIRPRRTSSGAIYSWEWIWHPSNMDGSAPDDLVTLDQCAAMFPDSETHASTCGRRS